MYVYSYVCVCTGHHLSALSEMVWFATYIYRPFSECSRYGVIAIGDLCCTALPPAAGWYTVSFVHGYFTPIDVYIQLFVIR